MNYAHPVEIVDNGRFSIPSDWYQGTLPSNIEARDLVYFDTSYSFTSFYSVKPIGLSIGYASGNYGRSIIMTGINGFISIGDYVILEATNIVCNECVTIGNNCMFSWGSVITDSWLDNYTFPSEVRKKMLRTLAHSELRYLNYENTKPVVVEDNCWVGFGSVILPGVRVGRGAVVGSKTVISQDVPPYAVIVGDPPRIIKYLNPDDTEEAKAKALNEYMVTPAKM